MFSQLSGTDRRVLFSPLASSGIPVKITLHSTPGVNGPGARKFLVRTATVRWQAEICHQQTGRLSRVGYFPRHYDNSQEPSILSRLHSDNVKVTTCRERSDHRAICCIVGPMEPALTITAFHVIAPYGRREARFEQFRRLATKGGVPVGAALRPQPCLPARHRGSGTGHRPPGDGGRGGLRRSRRQADGNSSLRRRRGLEVSVLVLRAGARRASPLPGLACAVTPTL